MSLAVWLGAVRKCSAAVVGLDMALGLSMVRRCSKINNHCFHPFCRKSLVWGTRVLSRTDIRTNAYTF